MSLLIFLVSFSLYHNYLPFITSLLLLDSLSFLLSSSDPLASLLDFYCLSLLSLSLFLWLSRLPISLWFLFSLISSSWWHHGGGFAHLYLLSLSLWWFHGGGFCSESVLVWIGDRGCGFFVGVLEFCGFWFGCGIFFFILLLATLAYLCQRYTSFAT